MVLPHSHRKGFNLRVNIYAILLALVLVVSITLAFLVLAAEYSTSDSLQVQRRAAEQQAQDELEQVVSDIVNLQLAARRFQSAMSNTMDTLGIPDSDSSSIRPADGDLGDLFGLQEVQEGDFRQLYDLQYIREQVDSSLSPIDRIYRTVTSSRDLLEDIPHIWPVRGNRGTISSMFGPVLHPVYDQWVVNRGLVISLNGVGDHVVSSANGIVARVDFDPVDKGWFVVVNHRYGFTTRYEHLGAIFVGEGESVSQGQEIGTVGKSGYAVQPQLGFTVMIGSDFLNPADFLQITAGRWTGYRRSGT
ncbi:M23 family metallopeptidase [Spirochaeta dissipatitropha]